MKITYEGYKIQDLKCCHNCVYMSRYSSSEAEWLCSKHKVKNKYNVFGELLEQVESSEVDFSGICDKYKRRENENNI
uniref:Uncharacterized protein n=1 Tax=viral metagenome TaxID=1070528 RepID=A0A6H1ZR25_9ZZZZ